jgi:hypothetical protein
MSIPVGIVLVRMKLPRAITASPPGGAQASVDHSHSHQSLPQARGSTADSARQPSEKSAIAVSPERAACVARRTA